MTAIGGARDTLLQATAERFSTTADGKAILLAGSTPVFRVNSAGAGAPGSIAITAKPVNVVGDIVFSVSAGTQMTVNGNVATVDFATMATDTALVQARIREFGVDYVGNYMISKVFDGVAGETGLAGLNTGQAFAYKRAAAAPADSPGDVIFTFATAAITTPAGNDLASGWSKNIPAGTAPLYVRVAAASSRNATDNIAANEWSAAVQMAKDGADGLNVAPVRIYQRGATNIAPALPSAACTFTFATGALTGLNNGWSTQVPTAGGAYLFTSGATAASRTATDDIAPGEWAAAARLAADGATGQRGTVTVTAPGYSTWSDASAVYELGHAGYGVPINRDVVTLYDATHAVTKYFDNGEWLVLGTVLNGNLLVDGSIAGKSLSADSLGAIKAKLGTVVAGDISASTIHGGPGYAHSSFDWPPAANSGGGFHLSEQGLLLGNYKSGRYFIVYANGQMEAPGLVIQDGNATFSGALLGASGSFKGTLTGRNVTAVNLAADMALIGTVIRSSTYNPGSYGWMINADGTAEFSVLSITGRPTGPVYGYSAMGSTPVTLATLGSATGIAAAHKVVLSVQGDISTAAALNSAVTLTIYRGTAAGAETTLVRTWGVSATTSGGGVWIGDSLSFSETFEIAVAADAGRTGSGAFFKAVATRTGSSTSGTNAGISLTTNIKNPTV